MEIRYTPSRADLRAGFYQAARVSRRVQLVLAGFGLFPVALSVAIALISRHAVTRADVVPGLILGAILVVLLPPWLALRTRRSERWLSISEAGIRTTVGEQSGEVPWREVAAIAATAGRVLIVGESGNVMVIPDRAFGSATERAGFLAELERFSGKPVRVTDRPHGEGEGP